MVEESEITCEHNEYARIPTAHVGDCPRGRNLDIPNKNEKDETQAIPKPVCFIKIAIHSSCHGVFLTYVDSNFYKAEFQQG
jgi:hypothetical protein